MRSSVVRTCLCLAHIERICRWPVTRVGSAMHQETTIPLMLATYEVCVRWAAQSVRSRTEAIAVAVAGAGYVGPGLYAELLTVRRA